MRPDGWRVLVHVLHCVLGRAEKIRGGGGGGRVMSLFDYLSVRRLRSSFRLGRTRMLR